jgi:hypothetical protein
MAKKKRRKKYEGIEAVERDRVDLHGTNGRKRGEIGLGRSLKADAGEINDRDRNRSTLRFASVEKWPGARNSA